jgi:hypothetical protein
MRIFFNALFILIFITSCNKTDYSKIKGIKWDPDLAAPVGYSNFDVYDILASQDKNDLVVINNLGELALFYNSEIASFTADQISQLNNQNIAVILSPSDQGIMAYSDFSGKIQSQSIEELLKFNLNKEVEIKEVFLHSGKLNIQVSTELQHDVDFNLSFPDLTINGNILTKKIETNYNGNSPHGNSVSIDLSDYKLDLTAGNNSERNKLRVNITTSIYGRNNPISGTENSTINFEFDDMSIDKAFGYFGKQSIVAESDSIFLKIFDSSTSGTVQLTNPKLNFTVFNSFGIPVQMDITSLKSINSNTGVTTKLISDSLNNIQLNSASNLGESSITSIKLNKSNTIGINSLVNNTPKYLSYSVNAVTNPFGLSENFISRDSKIKVKAELELSLEGYASNIVITDTIPFNFSENTELVEAVLIRIISENGFPISFQSQLEFIDNMNNSLFTLLEDNPVIIDAAPVNGEGKVTVKTKKVKDIIIPKNHIALLQNVKQIVIKGMASTTEPQQTTVKIFDNYNLNLKLSMQVQLKLSI